MLVIVVMHVVVVVVGVGDGGDVCGFGGGRGEWWVVGRVMSGGSDCGDCVIVRRELEWSRRSSIRDEGGVLVVVAVMCGS